MFIQRAALMAGSLVVAAAFATPASAITDSSPVSDSAGCVGQFSGFFAHGGLETTRSAKALEFAHGARPAGRNVYSHVAGFHGSLDACFDQT
jgi:hypothetical protein